ncbi:MAG: DUF1844 domain-containing protein [Phycisphaerales bacterium]|nr:DUF1844 domain-containing protein [Phycisphaerales bacterium]
MADQGEQPKIQIDSDWKSQAQAEKERLAAIEQEKAQSKAGGSSAAGAHGQLPPANWDTLMGMMATQALLYMGGYVDPQTNRPMVDLEAARHQIDLLGVLETKTKGNLTEEESKQLAGVLYELRMQYVRVAQAISGGGRGGAGGSPRGGGIKA